MRLTSNRLMVSGLRPGAEGYFQTLVNLGATNFWSFDEEDDGSMDGTNLVDSIGGKHMTYRCTGQEGRVTDFASAHSDGGGLAKQILTAFASFAWCQRDDSAFLTDTTPNQMSVGIFCRRVGATSDDNALFQMYDDNARSNTLLEFNADVPAGVVRLTLRNATGGSPHTFSYTYTATADTWVHYGLSINWDTNACTLYINGSPVSWTVTPTWGGAASFGANQMIRTTTGDNGDSRTAAFDSLFVAQGKAFSDAEMAQLYSMR